MPDWKANQTIQTVSSHATGSSSRKARFRVTSGARWPHTDENRFVPTTIPLIVTNGALALAGTIYGTELYVVNLRIIARLALSLFLMANQPFELMTRVVFGTLLSIAFYYTGSRREALIGS